MSGRHDDSEFELDRDARAFLAALRAEERLPAPVEARVWARLDAEVAGKARRTKVRVAVFVGLAIAAAILLAIGLGRGPSLVTARAGDDHQAGYERAEPPTATAARERAPERSIAAPPESPSVEAPVEEPPATTVPTPPRPKRSVSRSTAPDPTPDDLAEEAGLLRRAQRALVEGHPEAALRLLEQARARFERGALVPERAALEVVALCDAGRLDLAATARREFLRRYPDSPLRARVREACASSASRSRIEAPAD